MYSAKLNTSFSPSIGFRNTMVTNLKVLKEKEDWGMFIDSCFTHCQTLSSMSWNSPTSPRHGNKVWSKESLPYGMCYRYYKMLLFRYVNFDCHYVEQTIADAVGGWYSGRSQGVKDIDCACPGNPTCNSLLPT
jgi:hypothetical protein